MKIKYSISAVILIISACTIGQYKNTSSTPYKLFTDTNSPSPKESSTLRLHTTSTMRQDNNNPSIATNKSDNKIAFVYNSAPYHDWDHIYTMNLDGTNIAQLTFADYGQSYPSWSPYGEYIAFESADGITTTIYVMNSDGSDNSLLLIDPVIDGDPNWSPDGSQIVFVSGRDEVAPWTCKSDCSSEIYIMKSDGSNIRRITNSPGYDESPKWSPDGRRIVFSSNREGNVNIYIMKADGTEIVQLTDHLGYDGSPDWSPDGKQIVFVSDREGRNNLFIMDINGKNIRKLTNTVGDDKEPDWSPDGKQIIFVSSRDDPNPETCEYICNYEIYLLQLDNMKEIRITNTSGKESYPIWQP